MKNSLSIQQQKIIFSMREKKAREESLLQQCIGATAIWPLAFAQHRCITASLLFPIYKWREEEMDMGAPLSWQMNVRRGKETKTDNSWL
jgi:hypothetical protein